MIFIVIFIYNATITDYGDASVLLWRKYVWPIALSVTLANLNGCLVQVSIRAFSPLLYLMSDDMARRDFTLTVCTDSPGVGS